MDPGCGPQLVRNPGASYPFGGRRPGSRSLALARPGWRLPLVDPRRRAGL